MEEHAGADVVRFSDFRFDRRRGCLFLETADGALTPVAIGSRALDILSLLIDRKGDLVTRDEILNSVWPGVVEGANVTVQISALRRVLDEGRSEPSLVQTVPGRGYRLAAPVIPWEAEVHPEAHGVDNRTAAELTPVRGSLRRRTAGIASAAAIGAVLVLGVAARWLWPNTTPILTAQIETAASIPQAFAAPRLSIVVLPFANLSNDPDQQYFSDGITDDLTTDLSRITDMFVIARNTAFTYRDKPTDARHIGRELSVRYILEGSVQRSGSQARINAQLVDAEAGGHLWAERFERDTSDLFALQNEITTRIAVALHQELIAAEAARETERPDVQEYILRGKAAFLNRRHAPTLPRAWQCMSARSGSIPALSWRKA